MTFIDKILCEIFVGHLFIILETRQFLNFILARKTRKTDGTFFIPVKWDKFHHIIRLLVY